ncbi:MAG: hypothetical protein P8J18_03955 [Halieaceae bacterium]|nr:hypothetical protein [Halieaceae bacterium]
MHQNHFLTTADGFQNQEIAIESEGPCQARQIYNQILEIYPNNFEAKRSLEYINSIISDKEVLPAQRYLLEPKKLLDQDRFQDVIARSNSLTSDLNN